MDSFIEDTGKSEVIKNREGCPPRKGFNLKDFIAANWNLVLIFTTSTNSTRYYQNNNGYSIKKKKKIHMYTV